MRGLLARWWPPLRRRWRVAATAGSILDIPESLRSRTAVLISKADTHRWLVFDCPCALGHRVVLNLDPAHRPRWQVTRSDPLTLHPSVDEYTPTRHCHYIIRDGRVRWAERTDRHR